MKSDGMGHAASALRYWETRQEIAANNLANVSTAGFRGERVFARLLDAAFPAADTAIDLRAGALRQTGETLDLALEAADAFLVVDTPQGERLFRGGPLRIDESGTLVTAAGQPLLGTEGPIQLPDSFGELVIDGAGEVRVDGWLLDRLRLERVPGAGLTHEGAGLFVPGADRAGVAADFRGVRQGHLEDSNVNAIDALVDLVGIQRAYAAVQRVVTTLDSVRQTIANDIARPV